MVTAASTEQTRYIDQVEAEPTAEEAAALVARLSSLLPADAQTQVKMQMDGTLVHSRSETSPARFTGVADAVHEGKVWELKFVTELTREMFLQLAMYLVISGTSTGVLWNTRTDERWEVSVPDAKRFMHAVARAVTKQDYRAFEPAA